MSASTHTPGPWEAASGMSQMVNAGTTVVEVLAPTDDAPGWWVFSPADTHGARAADARLLAAAPELLAALRRSLDWLSSYPGGGTLGENGPYEQARAALAKAEGSAT